jgi:hypothetical protein
MTDQEKTNWRAVRANGRVWFVWRYGILGGGFWFATLIAIGNYFGAPGLHWHGIKSELIGFVIRALLFGTLFGFLVWRVNERRFESYQRD